MIPSVLNLPQTYILKFKGKWGVYSEARNIRLKIIGWKKTKRGGKHNPDLPITTAGFSPAAAAVYLCRRVPRVRQSPLAFNIL